MIGKKIELGADELLRMFKPVEGQTTFYYGRIRNGKTYSATADILDLLSQGRVVYANWHITYDGFDERRSFWHLFYYSVFFWKKRFYKFPRENLHYFSPDDVDIGFLSSLTDCDVFIDEGQWIFDSYEGTNFSKSKRKLILHTRHLNRSLNIISQRTQAIQVNARGQVNRFFKCSKKMSSPFLIFKREEFQDMAGQDVDETQEPISTKKYWARKKIFEAYNSYYYGDLEPLHKVRFEAYRLNFSDRLLAMKNLLALSLKRVGKLLLPLLLDQHLVHQYHRPRE